MNTLETPKITNDSRKGWRMTKDPICGMMVDEATALCADRDGHTLYFCSEHCRQKFLADDSLATASEGHTERHEDPHHGHHEHQAHQHESKQPLGAGKYFCPMCHGVESD